MFTNYFLLNIRLTMVGSPLWNLTSEPSSFVSSKLVEDSLSVDASAKSRWLESTDLCVFLDGSTPNCGINFSTLAYFPPIRVGVIKSQQRRMCWGKQRFMLEGFGERKA